MTGRLFSCTLLLIALAGCKNSQPATDSAPSPEAKAYVSQLKLGEVNLKATESFAGQVVTEIEGKITNSGNRTVEYAAVSCLFYDSMNQMILREKVPIVKAALKPGETRSFRLPFDDIPDSWNHQMPQLVVASIRLS